MTNEFSPVDQGALIDKFSRGVPSVRILDSYLNRITIINDSFVLKVPQDSTPMHLGALDHEWRALLYMEGLDVSPFAIPRPVEYSTDPAYLIATYVPGEVFSRDQINTLSKKSFEQFGRDLGNYILRQIAAADNYAQNSQPPQLAYGWPDIFAQYVGDFADPRYPTLSALSERVYTKWCASRSPLTDQSLRVIHGDLTANNIVFSTDGRLKGVIDFGRLHRGEMADELSCLPRSIHPSLLPVCAQELEQNGIGVNTEEVMLWSELKDLQVLPYWIKANNTSHPNFQAWKDIITSRYPNLDWSELF